ncbi:MAG: lysylphosphatidylglycerol synthase transmembrane domain-containing protein [Acidobacteriota bacterium]
MSRALRLTAGLGAAGVLLWLFSRGVDFRVVWMDVRSAHLSWLAACLFFTLTHYLVRAWRWRLLLTPIRRRIPLRPLVESILAGYAVTHAVPGRLGEVVRPAHLARRERLPFASLLTTVGLDRILDALALILLLLTFLMVAPTSGPGALPPDHAHQLRRTGWIVGVVLALLLPLLWVLAPSRGRMRASVESSGGWRNRVMSLWDSIQAGLGVLRGPAPLAGALLGSLLIWVVLSAQVWSGIRAFGIHLPFSAAFVLISFLALGIAVPTPAGAGGFHYAGQFCLVQIFGVQRDLAVASLLVLHIIAVVPALLLGGWVLARQGSTAGSGLTGKNNASKEPGSGSSIGLPPGTGRSRMMGGRL